MTNKKILIVENDADTRFILNKRLTDTGYEVECCATGYSLVDGRTVWPDLFVLDKDLPGIDGIALCKYLKLKAASKQIPIIMLSAHPEVKAKALKAGVSGFIAKPFDLSALLKSVDSYVNNALR